MAHTGKKIYLQRLEVFADTSGNPIVPHEFTGKMEQNVEFLDDGTTPDPNYIPMEEDIVMCPKAFKVHLKDSGSGNACSGTATPTTAYFSNTTGADVDSIIYTEVEAINRVDGGGRYWYDSYGDQYKIDADGKVVSKNTCPL